MSDKISVLIQEFLDDRRIYCVDYTVKTYEIYLSRFFDWLPADDIALLSKDTLKQYVLSLRGTMKNVSVRTCYRHVKAFCKWLYQEDYLETDITVGVKLPKNDAAIVEPLTTAEVKLIDEAIINKSITNLMALRNYCIFHLMLDCGLRRKEVINLQKNDYKSGRLIIRNGKGNKDRIVLLPDFLYSNIHNYYNRSHYLHEHFINKSPYVFLDYKCKNQITFDTIKSFFQDLKEQSGVSRIHGHLCRHTFATSYLQYGGDMEKLRLMMGHSDYEILKNYLHLSLYGNQNIYRLNDIFFD